MQKFILIVQGTRQKHNLKENSGNNRFKTVTTELYSIIKGLFITIFGGLVVLYLAGLLTI